MAVLSPPTAGCVSPVQVGGCLPLKPPRSRATALTQADWMQRDLHPSGQRWGCSWAGAGAGEFVQQISSVNTEQGGLFIVSEGQPLQALDPGQVTVSWDSVMTKVLIYTLRQHGTFCQPQDRHGGSSNVATSSVTTSPTRNGLVRTSPRKMSPSPVRPGEWWRPGRGLWRGLPMFAGSVHLWAWPHPEMPQGGPPEAEKHLATEFEHVGPAGVVGRLSHPSSPRLPLPHPSPCESRT